MRDVEQSSLDVLVARLTGAFPDLDEADVRAAVDAALNDLANARLRHYVPLLVEKQARAACRVLRQARAAEPARLASAGRE